MNNSSSSVASQALRPSRHCTYQGASAAGVAGGATWATGSPAGPGPRIAGRGADGLGIGRRRRPRRPARAASARPDRLGHEQGGRGSAAQAPGSSRSSHSRPAGRRRSRGGQHGQDDQVAAHLLIIETQAQRDRQPGDAASRCCQLRPMKRSVYIVDITSAPMASAPAGADRPGAGAQRRASSQTASITRFRPATIRAGRYVAPRSPHQLKTRSPSHRTMATLTTRVHSSQTAWLAAASAQGSSSTAHQANSSQVSAPVW